MKDEKVKLKKLKDTVDKFTINVHISLINSQFPPAIYHHSLSNLNLQQLIVAEKPSKGRYSERLLGFAGRPKESQLICSEAEVQDYS